VHLHPLLLPFLRRENFQTSAPIDRTSETKTSPPLLGAKLKMEGHPVMLLSRRLASRYDIDNREYQIYWMIRAANLDRFEDAASGSEQFRSV